MTPSIPAHIAQLMAGAVQSQAPVKRKKGETPRITLPDTHCKVSIPTPSTEFRELPMCEAFAELCAQAKDAETRKGALGADLVALAEPARVNLARSEGAYLSSVVFDGLMYVHCPPHFTAKLTDPNRVAEVQSLFDVDFWTYFTPVCTLDLTPATIEALRLAGIKYSLDYKPAKALQEARTMNRTVAEKCAIGLPEFPCIQYVKVK